MSERPWGRALLWLLFLGPFFFATYNFANYVASQRAYVPVVMFSWERYIPLIPWTIVPYWSSDLFYAVSLFVCRTREELDLHGKRLLAIQLVATACFLAFPLRCSWEIPALTGWEGQLFSALQGFDRPFNQAPSLHVALAVILWTRFNVALTPWFALMAISTLTTHQHHFIDVPTGAWAGLLVLAALPDKRTAPPQIRLTLLYLAGALVCAVIGFYLHWLLLWPAFALSMVAAAYWTANPKWLKWGLFMLPYTVAAWVNSRCWTQGESATCHLADGVWFGRAPLPWERNGTKSIVDLAPELRLTADAHVAILDLTVPTNEQLSQAVQAVLRLPRPTLVCCALGYSRSATVSAAWLVACGSSVNDAIAQVQRARPQVIISEAHRIRLNEWA